MNELISQYCSSEITKIISLVFSHLIQFVIIYLMHSSEVNIKICQQDSDVLFAEVDITFEG